MLSPQSTAPTPMNVPIMVSLVRKVKKSSAAAFPASRVAKENLALLGRESHRVWVGEQLERGLWRANLREAVDEVAKCGLAELGLPLLTNHYVFGPPTIEYTP